jgi:Flp pilus assembly protein TadD
MQSAGTAAEGNYLVGRAYYEAGHFDETAHALLLAVEDRPVFPDAHFELGKVYISQRRNLDAVKELKLAIEQAPDNPHPKYFLGALLVQNGDPETGAAYLRQVGPELRDSWALAY